MNIQCVLFIIHVPESDNGLINRTKRGYSMGGKRCYDRHEIHMPYRRGIECYGCHEDAHAI
jgi:hypothetical protein